MNNELILVDCLDNIVGYADKSTAHQVPLLHRAFSIFIVDKNKMLIQQRSTSKYHSGGLWANACCSHPRRNEDLCAATQRRLYEELGIGCDLTEIGNFVYFSSYQENLCEYEYDHLFLGEYSGKVSPNSNEIECIKWVDIEQLEQAMLENPKQFATWFLIACPMVIKRLYGHQ